MSSEWGLAVIKIKGKMYCAKCGMPVVNDTEWKQIHFDSHDKVPTGKSVWFPDLIPLRSDATSTL